MLPLPLTLTLTLEQVFSPDFVRFFAQTAWLLRADATLWCVSTHPNPNPNPNQIYGEAWDVIAQVRVRGRPEPEPEPEP